MAKNKKKFQLFALLGFPLSHTLSPPMHNAALKKLHMRGMYVPFEIAPTHVVIVPLTDSPELIKKAKKIHQQLEKKGIRVVTDDSSKRPGAKYYHWETRGVPLRIEIGSREVAGNNLTIARRDTGKKEQIKDSELNNYLKTVGKNILDNLRSQAESDFKGKVKNASTLAEVSKILDKGGIARANFFSMGKEGTRAAEEVYEKTNGGEIRGTWHGKNEKPKGKCFYTGKEAKHVVYIARAH